MGTAVGGGGKAAGSGLAEAETGDSGLSCDPTASALSASGASAFGVSAAGSASANGEPQVMQNRDPASLSVPQLGHFMGLILGLGECQHRWYVSDHPL